MTATESCRATTVTYLTPSHIEGLPYETRKEVVTSYEDARADSREWDDLSDAEREDWTDWLDRMHAQQCRLAEMNLSGNEHERFAGFDASDWDGGPSQLAAILDEIEAERIVG